MKKIFVILAFLTFGLNACKKENAFDPGPVKPPSVIGYWTASSIQIEYYDRGKLIGIDKNPYFFNPYAYYDFKASGAGEVGINNHAILSFKYKPENEKLLFTEVWSRVVNSYVRDYYLEIDKLTDTELIIRAETNNLAEGATWQDMKIDQYIQIETYRR